MAERQAIYEDRKVSIQAWFPLIDVFMGGWIFKSLGGGNPVCVGKDCRIGSFELGPYFRENGCDAASAKIKWSNATSIVGSTLYLGTVALNATSIYTGWSPLMSLGYGDSILVALAIVGTGMAAAIINDLAMLPASTWSFNRCLREQLGLQEFSPHRD